MYEAQYASQLKQPTRPVEKILELALALPESAELLELEALRLERVLDSVQDPVLGGGEELVEQFVEIAEYQIEGIFGILDAQNEEDFEESCRILLMSDSKLQHLECQLQQIDETVVLCA